MRIAQVVLPDASEYERKSQRIDFAELAREHDIVPEREAEVVHVYGLTARVLPSAAANLGGWQRIAAGVRRVMPASLAQPGVSARKGRGMSVTPLKDAPGYLPEAVEEAYFADAVLHQTQTVGVFVRRSVEEMVDRTRARVARTREDIEWRLFRRAPTPEEMGQIAVWFDPATQEDDFDGFVAEALVAGRIVVASRTPINVQRLEKGRTGLLVPGHDPNEATHAILTALFKPEAGRPRAEAAAQTITKFRARQRMRALAHIYETLIR